MARTVTTFFNMKENYSGGMRRAARATSEFQRKVTAAARVLDRENKKRREIKINSRNANSAIAQVSAQLKKIKDLRINIAARTQNFKRDMKPVTNDIKNLVKKPLLVTLKLKDMALAGLRKAGDLLKSLAKGVTIGLGIAGGAMAYTLGKGATLQQYQASIEHNVFSANRNLTENQVQAQAKAYANWLTEFAAKTTASVDDIFAGGAHALAGTGGNVKAAKQILKTAQDMAAQRPGASTWDAVEAILDMSLGQYRRATEFGFKVSEEAMNAAGGDVFKVKDQLGRTLEERFAGAEARKAGTGAGKWDSIKGTVEGGIMQAGANILDALTPLLIKLMPFADTLAAKMADMGTSIGTWITDTVPKLSQLWDDLKAFFEPIAAWANEKWNMLKPFRDFAANAFAGVNVDGEKVLGGITGAIDSLVNTLISWLNGLAANWDRVEPVIAGIIKFLPQIALAFAGFKVLSWGMTTGKAIGNFFGGAGQFLGKLFGRGSTPAVPPGQDTVLDKAGKTTPKAGPKTNTFTGPNYNTFQGPNYNAGNGQGSGMPGSGGLPPVVVPPSLSPGSSPLGLPTGTPQLRLPPGQGGSGSGFNWGFLANGLAGAGFLAALLQPGSERARQEQWRAQAGMPGSSMPVKPVTIPTTVTANMSAIPAGLKKILNGGTVNGNIRLMTYNGGGGPGSNTEEKHAAGIKRVPFDNYPALLHKGEAVLPSGEAGEYRDGGRRGGNFTVQGGIHIHGANKDGEQLAAEILRGLERAAFNMA